MKTLLVRTLGEWRDWLTEHHASIALILMVAAYQVSAVASVARSFEAMACVRQQSDKIVPLFI